MAALRRARRAAAGLALALVAFAALAACGRDKIEPIPPELRRLEQQEAGCIACHNGRDQPTLDPNKVMTPAGHPSTMILRRLGAAERSRLTSGR